MRGEGKTKDQKQSVDAYQRMIQGGAIPESEPDKLGKQGKHL